ncbi:MAG: ammonium transporter [Pseudomonadota bacterium]
MEEQLAELAAKVAELEGAGVSGNTMLAELYYYLTIPLMFIIHAGFLAYEMGASRQKNVLASGIKNILAFAFVIPAFYFFGWWIYWAFPTGLSGSAGGWGISGFEVAAAYLPWAEASGPNLGDNATGVFFGAFALFAATTASIFSGAVIERIQVVGFLILAIFLGGVAWILGGAWGWHADGWLVTAWGYHDFGAAGVVHMVAGFFALGVLINLGPRIGKFNADGSANEIPGHNMPFTITGLMLIIVGFWGFLMGCIIIGGEAWSWSGTWSTIYGTPMTVSAMTFNVLMGFAGGVIGAWVVARDPFWMMSGALAGIISCAAGLDLWWPPLAFAIAFLGGAVLKPASDLLESFGIDDAVGAVTVHGTIGIWGVLAVGIFASGYPAYMTPEGAEMTYISFGGQLVGAVVMFLLGFVPGYVLSLILKIVGLLRCTEEAEIAGLDLTKVPAKAYPEGISASPTPAE